MAVSEKKVIYQVNGLPSSGKHQFVQRIQHFFKDALVVDFSEKDEADFVEAFERWDLLKKDQKKPGDFLLRSFWKYNEKMEQALKQDNSKIIITINDPFFLAALYKGLNSPVLSVKKIEPALVYYDAMIAPHRKIDFIIKCDPKEALENWIKKKGEIGSFLNIYDFLEMFNNILYWKHVDSEDLTSITPSEFAEWYPDQTIY